MQNIMDIVRNGYLMGWSKQTECNFVFSFMPCQAEFELPTLLKYILRNGDMGNNINTFFKTYNANQQKWIWMMKWCKKNYLSPASSKAWIMAEEEYNKQIKGSSNSA